ncbi:MAG: D-glycerate dehydrogenase, partial [Syntrophobacterales bacterium]|nr:D-glycerate dehydrogenase [Syntrophobacterales bacterium]
MSNPKVFITRPIPEAGLNMVLDACDAEIWPDELPPPRDLLLENVCGMEGILSLLTDRIDGEVMDAAGPQLKIVSNYAVGFDNIDVQAATDRGILVGNTPGILTETTADLAFALLMAAARRLGEGIDYIRAGKWETFKPMELLGRDIHHATLGIIGMGRIGTEVARRAKGFDMDIIYYNHSGRAEKGETVGARMCSTLDELLAQADFISLHVPLTPETHHLIDARALGKMKRTAILVNTSRGQVVDSDALYEALRSGQITCAALDVTDPEPLPPDHKLLSLPNCLVTPHIGSASVATR